jgi:monofunctional biosynthetic peptidoglycan transglycosylase
VLSRALRRGLRWLVAALLLLYAAALLSLAALRWIDPPTTAVQAERRVQSWFSRAKYQKRRSWAPLARVSPNLQHAVIAAEDSRFYQHHGFDWEEIKDAIHDEADEGRLRGASTLDQQLVKNLLLGTWRSPLRKAAEAGLVWPAEFLLGKQRILELYLNVVEWGPGVYGAEAASNFYFHARASRLTREQAARLAAILPAPRRRKPARMDRYSAIILDRMGRMGW